MTRRKGGGHPKEWTTCQRCGIRWETDPRYGSPLICQDCKFVDPMFGRRAKP